MQVKVLMTWDIAAERDQEYFEFIIGEFIPGVQRLGLQATAVVSFLYQGGMAFYYYRRRGPVTRALAEE